MLRPRLTPSHVHVIPTIVLYVVTISLVDLGNIFGMAKGSALGVYSAQCLLAISTYYLLLLMNWFDWDHYSWDRWSPQIVRKLRGPMSYFLFVMRVWLMSAIEGLSVILLLFPEKLSRDKPVAFGVVMLCCVVLHVLVEFKRLGRHAWQDMQNP